MGDVANNLTSSVFTVWNSIVKSTSVPTKSGPLNTDGYLIFLISGVPTYISSTEFNVNSIGAPSPSLLDGTIITLYLPIVVSTFAGIDKIE